MGVLIFEFSQFHPSDFEHDRDLVEAMDRFLGSLPAAWQYGVEIRNKSLLHARNTLPACARIKRRMFSTYGVECHRFPNNWQWTAARRQTLW